MGAYTTITAKIAEKLEAIDKIAQVVNNPELEFTDYPVATIEPAEGESDYETNAEDLRVYAYQVNLYYETKTGGISNAIEALYDAIDDILDSFASDKQLTGMSLGANKQVMVVEPVSAGWSEVPDKDLIFARVNINVNVSVLN